MFDIAWSEFLVVAVVALVVVGPKDLPALLRTVGKTVASLRRMAGDFQSQFNEAMREAELDDLKNELTGMKDAASKLAGPNPFEIARNELKNALEDRPKPPSALAGVSDAAPAAPDTPSALAPELPPIDEPPAPGAADFAFPASKAESVGSATPEAAKPAAEKPAPKKATVKKAKPVEAKPVEAKPVEAKPAEAAAPAAPKRKAAPRKAKAAEPPAPGAAS